MFFRSIGTKRAALPHLRRANA